MTLEMLAIVPVAAAAFVATNLDNVMILVALLARYVQRPVGVAVGYVASLSVVIVVSWWIGDVADNLPVQYLGFLGVIPLIIGVRWLLRATDQSGTSSTGATDEGEGVGTVVSVTFSSQLSNGTDTILTFSILFAESVQVVDWMMIGTMYLVGLLLFLLALYTLKVPSIQQPLSGFAQRVTPFVMILVGLYILANTSTDLMP